MRKKNQRKTRHEQGEAAQEVDARVLGQILAAQNVIFSLPDATRVAEFYSQTLLAIPGILACRVCLANRSIQAGEMENIPCAACEASRRDGPSGFVVPADPDFHCALIDQRDVRVIAIDSYQHHFGFFVFTIDRTADFDAYQPFIKNLSNHVALIFENRLQENLLQEAQHGLERRVEERTRDLTIANEELQHEIAERQRTEKALRASENRFRVLSENAFVGIYIIQNGRLSYVNSTLAKIFGYTTGELLGAEPALVIHPDDQALVAENIRRRIAGEIETVHYEFRGRCKDGKTKNIEVLGGRIDFGGQPAIIGNLMDITERKKAENALRESELRYREIFDNVMDGLYLLRVGEDGRFPVIEVNPAVERISGISCSSFPGKTPEEIIPAEAAARINEIFRYCIETGLPVEAEAELDLPVGHRSIHSTLIPAQDATGRIQRIIGISRDVTDRKRHELERESIITVSTTLRQATTKSAILDVILDQLMELFKADGAVLVLPDPQTKGLIDEMARGPVGERMVGLSIPPETGVSNWVIKNKQPYLNNRADQDQIFYRPDLLGESHCLAAVPLIAQEHAIGALWIACHSTITKQDLGLLTAVADIAANAIHRVTLYEQTEQQLHHLMALHQIDIAISANFDLNVTLKVILKNVKDELEVDAASILLLNPVTHTLDYAAGDGFRTNNIESSHVRLGNGCAGRAAQTYRTVFSTDLSQAPGTFSRSLLLVDEKFKSHYATPMIVKGQVKGVLEVFHREVFDTNQEWIDYFETLAAQAAIAIENASLFENLQRSNLELMLAYDATIEGWSRALDLRDRETEGHTQRVTEMALALAEKLGMSDAEKTDLRRGALLHDIGKMGVPDAILLKPGPLSESEWEWMRKHPLYAFEMLSHIPYLKRALDIPYCHHEKWDGSGYPRGLKGKSIPLSARLFALVDVFDALTSDRPYRTAWTGAKAYHFIREQSGISFDPSIVEIFLKDME
ncbi:MAG: PAS domain S-box protein [Anaerolineales bacterium]